MYDDSTAYRPLRAHVSRAGYPNHRRPQTLDPRRPARARSRRATRL